MIGASHRELNMLRRFSFTAHSRLC